MGSRHRSAPSGPFPDAVRRWCDWIYLHAELSYRTTPNRLTPEGKPSTWLDFMGQTSERPLMEAAMRASVWSPPLPDEDVFT
jgi:hypothetical protein